MLLLRLGSFMVLPLPSPRDQRTYAAYGLAYIPMRSQRCSAVEGSERWFTRSCWFVGWLQLQASPRLRRSAPPSTCWFLLRLQATPSIPSE
uniref:Uncharacterized protein n=1 Tax=Aegilops tauschii subsp. strangulata TaxID=200361 RepID=A0A453LU36_AEGTS